MFRHERASRPGLQEALEAGRLRLIRERHDDVQPPRTVTRCLRTSPGVMVFQPAAHVRCQPDIEARIRVSVPDHVDEAFISSHGDRWSKRDARRDERSKAETRASSDSRRRSCQPRLSQCRQLLPASTATPSRCRRAVVRFDDRADELDLRDVLTNHLAFTASLIGAQP
jgi:hypothetical protein